MKITTGISLRHIHLTEEDYNLLFDEPLTPFKELNQPGQFSSKQKVTIKNGEKCIENVRIVGPLRTYSQVEISQTDAYFLKLNPPIKQSGDLKGAAEIIIEGPNGEIKRKACIISERHIHITPHQRKELNLTKDYYNVEIKGKKGGILYDVHIVEKEDSCYEMHIDSDDANAHNMTQQQEVEIII